MSVQRAGPMSPKDNGVPSTTPTNSCEHSTMPQKLSVSHLRPAPSKLPPAALSPYLVKGPLTFSPTAYLTHKTLLFLINISQPSITCLCTENLQNPLEQVLILTLGKYAAAKAGESNDAPWGEGGRTEHYSNRASVQRGRRIARKRESFKSTSRFPWKGG